MQMRVNGALKSMVCNTMLGISPEATLHNISNIDHVKKSKSPSRYQAIQTYQSAFRKNSATMNTSLAGRVLEEKNTFYIGI